MKKTVIACDWDGVVHDRKGWRYGLPFPGTEEVLEALIQEGIEIIIFTVVARTQKGRQSVLDWLDKHDIPYTDVTALKPIADIYIDDRALHHTDWPSTLKEINRRLNREIEWPG